MKKVSVQFNLEVCDDVTHRQIKEIIREQMQWYSITSIQINNIEKGKK